MGEGAAPIGSTRHVIYRDGGLVRVSRRPGERDRRCLAAQLASGRSPSTVPRPSLTEELMIKTGAPNLRVFPGYAAIAPAPV